MADIKSRYEVISDMERQKRDLIKERDGMSDVLLSKEKNLKRLVRDKADQDLEFDRQIEDAKDDIANFKKTVEERKETITELIKSVEESLNRFNKIQKDKDK